MQTDADTTSSSIPLEPVERITHSILVLRGHKVLLDADLAALYGVSTKRFNEQVRRNIERFPADFMFRLSQEEAEALLRSRSQNATLKQGSNIKHLPHVFTEHGAIMAATVLNSAKAVQAAIFVVRAFVKLRELLASHRDLAKRLEQVETELKQQLVAQDRKLSTHEQAITGIFKTLRELMNPPQVRAIGFTADLGLKKPAV
jgi:hypothetical protein